MGPAGPAGASVVDVSPVGDERTGSTMTDDRGGGRTATSPDDGYQVVDVPTVGTGRRFQRRLEAAARRRRRRIAVVAGVVLVAALIGVGLVVVDQLTGDGGTTAPVALDVDPEPVAGDAAPKALFLQVRDGGLVGVTAAILRADGPGGSLVFVPVSTLVDIPGFNLDPLRRSLELGDAELVRLAVENLLGVEFELPVVLDDRAFATLAADVGVLTVDNPAPVEVEGGDGRVTVEFPAGSIDLAPERIAAYLAVASVGQPELQRLLRHAALWRAFLAAEAEVDRPVGDPSTDLGSFLHQLAAGPVRADLLPVEALSGAGEDSLYRVDTDAVAELMAEVAPETVGGGRMRVQVLNGEGSPGLAQRVAELIVPAGARVAMTDNARSFDVDVTQILYYRDERRADAERIREVLDVGEVVKDRNTLDAVDITIVVGSDFVERYGDGDAPRVADTGAEAPPTTAGGDGEG